MDLITAQTGSDSFQQYLSKHKNVVRDKSSAGYYHVDVVAEAYTQGFTDGKNSGEQDFISNIVKQEVEKFTQRANQIYILSKRLISYLTKYKYCVSSLHIKLSFSKPSVIISVSDEFLNNDKFIQLAYSKMFEIKDIYSKLFDEYLDLGLVSANNLDISLLEEDGFGYKEVFSEQEKNTR